MTRQRSPMLLGAVLLACAMGAGCSPGGDGPSAQKKDVAPGPKPSANFAVSPDCGDSPVEVTFTDMSFGNIDSWLWEFDDGTTSTQKTPPPRTYTNIRTYRVKLTVSSGGIANSRTIPIQVVEPLIAPVNLETSMIRKSVEECGNPRDPWRYGLT